MKSEKPVYDTVNLGGHNINIFGTIKQLEEYIGEENKGDVLDVWVSLISGSITDNIIIATYGGRAYGRR